MSRTPPHMTTLVGVALRGWSEHIRDWSHILVFFFFLFFSFAFRVTHTGHIFFTDLDYIYAIKHVSVQACTVWGLGNRGQPKQNFPNGRK